MINIAKVKAYCKDYQNIDNFMEAYEDLSETWHCHHKLEIHDDYENSEESKEKMSESAKHRKKPHPGGKCFKGMKWKVVDGKRIWYV